MPTLSSGSVQPSRATSGVAAAGITLVAACVYAATLSRHYMGDGLQFTMAVESADLARLLQPNHMLYPLLGLGCFRLWQLFGWTGGALAPLQVLSALAGAVAVGLMYRIAVGVTKRRDAAAVVAAGFGVSYGLWAYSTDAESVTVALAASLVVLDALTGSGGGAPRRPAVLALLCSLAIVTYQTNVFLVPVVLVALLGDRSLPWRVRVRRGTVFAALVAVLCGAVYGLVAWVVFGVRTWGELLDWQFHLSRLGLWGHWSPRSIVQGAYAFLRTLAGFPGLGPSSRTAAVLAEAGGPLRVAFAGYYALLSLLAVAPIVVLTVRRHALRPLARELAVLSAWAACFGLFAVYWVPGDVQFWVPVSVVWWLMAGVAYAMWTKRAADPRQTTALGVGVVAALAAANLATTIIPNRDLRTNRPYQVARSVAERTAPQDLVVTSGGDLLFLYVPYFAERQTLSIYHQTLHGAGGPKAAWAVARRVAAETVVSGHRVYLVGFNPGRDAWWDVLQRAGISRAHTSKLETTLAWRVQGEHVLEWHP